MSSNPSIPNFRRGPGIEYLAQSYLNYLGAVTPVPWQEDIGFDFVCHRLFVESKSFGLPFYVQVKSSEANFDWESSKIKWLYSHRRMPFFVGIVDTKNDNLTFSLYWTGDFWFGRLGISDENAIKKVSFRFKKCPEKAEPESRFDGQKGCLSIYLGEPVLKLDRTIFQEEPFLPDEEKCRPLDRVILADWENLQHAAHKLPYFMWQFIGEKDEFFYRYRRMNQTEFREMLDFHRPFFNAIAIHLGDSPLSKNIALFLHQLKESWDINFSQEDLKFIQPLFNPLDSKTSAQPVQGPPGSQNFVQGATGPKPR